MGVFIIQVVIFSRRTLHEIDCGIFFTDNKGRVGGKKAAAADYEVLPPFTFIK